MGQWSLISQAKFPLVGLSKLSIICHLNDAYPHVFYFGKETRKRIGLLGLK